MEKLVKMPSGNWIDVSQVVAVCLASSPFAGVYRTVVKVMDSPDEITAGENDIRDKVARLFNEAMDWEDI